MLLTLDLNDPRPLHEQVSGTIRRAIADGSYAPGDRLPPARDLADALGINANTVLRALRELRDEGLLEFRRGRGVSVLSGPTPAWCWRRRRVSCSPRPTGTATAPKKSSTSSGSCHDPARTAAART